MFLVSIGYGKSSVSTKGLWGYLDARRRLTSLVLIAIHHANDFLDNIGSEPFYLVRGPVFLDVRREDGVQHRIGRQRVFVFLVRSQFC